MFSLVDGLVNDTLTGDPLFTVPILTGLINQTTNPSDIPSHCYEVHGRAGEYFNLISDECSATINGNILNSREYSNDGIRIRWNVMNTRVSIAVPNCADNQLVMWVFCSHGQVEDPVTWVYYNITFMRFVVMRGLNLNEFSHGIIGN